MAIDHQRLVSTALSFLLRHNNEGKLEIARDGYADVDTVIELINARSKEVSAIVRMEDVIEAVNGQDKVRFELSDDERQIRAISGHSFPVDIPGEEYVPSGSLWFGTTAKATPTIEEHGLSHTSKLKVRLRETFEEALAIAEMRAGDPLVVEVDAERLHSDGYEFSLLSNGEVVTDRFGVEYCTLIPLETFSPGL